MRQKKLDEIKIPMTPGIEPAAFELEAQCFNQLRYLVPREWGLQMANLGNNIHLEAEWASEYQKQQQQFTENTYVYGLYGK
jgi:hypothetical protein